MYIKKRQYGREVRDPELVVAPGQTTHLQVKPTDPTAVWVPEVKEALPSTTGSGGADLHLYHQRRRWERNEEWERNQQEKQRKEREERLTVAEARNAQLEALHQKRRARRLRRKKVKKGGKAVESQSEQSIEEAEDKQSAEKDIIDESEEPKMAQALPTIQDNKETWTRWEGATKLGTLRIESD